MRKQGLVFLVAAWSAGCVDAPEVELSSTAGESFEEFRARTPLEFPGGGYLIEGDIAIHGDEALRELWSARQQGALTLNRVDNRDDVWLNGTQRELTYCVSNAFLPDAHRIVRDAIQSAAGEWATRARVQFKYLRQHDANCTNGNLDVVFSVEPQDNLGALARAFYPYEARPTRQILVSRARVLQIDRGAMGHELGHVLGFRHEHVRITYDPFPSDNMPCDDDDVTPWRAITAYDELSIMHYARCRLGSQDAPFEWTEQDRAGVATLYGGSPQVPADLMWRQSGGPVVVWQMTQTAAGAEAWGQQQILSSLTSSPDWRVVAVADFTGDGVSDVMWRRLSTGALTLWKMNLGRPTTLALTVAPGNDWQVQGAGDFNGDGKSDILWRHVDGGLSIWMMNGAQVLQQTWPQDVPGNEWQVKGVGDFDGDARADIAWESNTAVVAIWLMNGPVLRATGWHQATASDTLVGVGQIDREVGADLIWRTANGGLVFWSMDGIARRRITGQSTTRPGAEWQVQGLADYNADGAADVVWRHVTLGTISVWLTNTAAPTSAQPRQVLTSPVAAPGSDWSIVATGQFD